MESGSRLGSHLESCLGSQQPATEAMDRPGCSAHRAHSPFTSHLLGQQPGRKNRIPGKEWILSTRGGSPAGGRSVHAPSSPSSQLWDLSLLEWGEKAKALKGHALAEPQVSLRTLGTARPLSVLSYSVCWKPKGTGREGGTGQSDRGHMLHSNQLLAQSLQPSLTWGQALSESCLAPLLLSLSGSRL